MMKNYLPNKNKPIAAIIFRICNNYMQFILAFCSVFIEKGLEIK